jgi:DNA-binding FadR family transcriptional regulator
MAHLVKLETTPDLVEQVYVRLLDAISDGSLAPGQRITQEDIAAQLAVSRQPVLQALRLLKKDGFLFDAPGRGLLVAALDAAWIVKVYQVRGALDPRWSGWFDQLAISHDAEGNTLLSGPVSDQAALYGLINRLRDLGMTLLAVARLPS